MEINGGCFPATSLFVHRMRSQMPHVKTIVLVSPLNKSFIFGNWIYHFRTSFLSSNSNFSLLNSFDHKCYQVIVSFGSFPNILSSYLINFKMIFELFIVNLPFATLLAVFFQNF